MAHRPLEISRRGLGRILVALPFASLLHAEDAKKQPPSAEAEFIASHETGLSPAERERLQKTITEGERPTAPRRAAGPRADS